MNTRKERELYGQMSIFDFMSNACVVPENTIKDDILKNVLRTGGCDRNTLLRITVALIEGLNDEALAKFLENEYKKGGKGFTFDNKKIAIWFDSDGIKFKIGLSAVHDEDRIVTWIEASEMIHEMYQKGCFCTKAITENAIENEISEMTEFLSLHLSDATRNDNSLKTIKEYINSSYGCYKLRKTVREDLENNPSVLIDILESLEEDITINPELYHGWVRRNNGSYLLRVKNLSREKVWIPQNYNEDLPKLSFITDDEIDGALSRGSGFSGGKERICKFFLEEHTKTEQAEFLKHEYGIGGRSHVLGHDSFSENYDAKGIQLDKGDLLSPEINILIKWPEAADRINKMIQQNRY